MTANSAADPIYHANSRALYLESLLWFAVNIPVFG